MTTTAKKKGAASAATDPRHAHPNPAKDLEMNMHAYITSPDVRTIDLTALIELRNDLYHAAALCEALHYAMESCRVANGLPELVMTIENAIDGAAERIHEQTFAPSKPGAFAKAASGYHDALAALNAHDGDDKELQRLSAAFDVIRDRVFAFRPSTMEEVAQKAAFIAKHHDDAEGMNPSRLQQLLESMGASA